MKTRLGMRASLTIAALALTVITVQLACASEKSEQLYSAGLVEFHAGRYQEALNYFEQAVAADPQDAYALYYRGVTRGRLGNLDGAITDLRAMRGAKPDLDQAALELGVALVQKGKDKEAVELLQQAQRDPALESEASLFLGLAQLRLRQSNSARENLQRAAAKNPELEVPARYYQGVADYQARNWKGAESNFGYVATTSPASPMGKEAGTMLTKLKEGAAQRPAASMFEVYGSTGFEYDSNVALAPDNEDLKSVEGISDQDDFRAVFLVGGRVTPFRKEGKNWVAQVSLGYEFFQSLHFDLTDFDIQDHRPYVQGVVDVDRYQFGFLGRYDYYFSGHLNSFLQQGTTLPWFGIAEGKFGRTELFFRWRRQDFLQKAFDVLDGNNYSPGFRQYAYIGGTPEKYVWAGYRYDHEDPLTALGNVFGYSGNEVSVGAGWKVDKVFGVEGSYAYRHEDFFQASDGRVDNEHQFTVVGTKPIGEHFSLYAAFFGIINNSNQDLFTYQRYIGSLGIQVRY